MPTTKPLTNRAFQRLYNEEINRIPTDPDLHQREFRMLYNTHRQRRRNEPAGVAILAAARSVKDRHGVVPLWDEAFVGVHRAEV